MHVGSRAIGLMVAETIFIGTLVPGPRAYQLTSARSPPVDGGSLAGFLKA